MSVPVHRLTFPFLAFALMAASLSFWIPTLSGLLHELGHGRWVWWAFLTQPVGTLLAPVVFGRLADGAVAPRTLLIGANLASALLLGFAYMLLEMVDSAPLFVACFAFSNFFSAASWSLIGSVSMQALAPREDWFPLAALGGPVGWLIAAQVISFVLPEETTFLNGYLATGVRILATGCLMMIPGGTEPERRERVPVSELLAAVLSSRYLTTLYLSAGLIAIPLAVFFPGVPLFFVDLGFDKPTSILATGQGVEIVFLLLAPIFLQKVRARVLVSVGIISVFFRYAILSWVADSANLYMAMLACGLHGVWFPLFFICGLVSVNRHTPKHLQHGAVGLFSSVHGGVGTLIGMLILATSGSLLPSSGVADPGISWGSFWAGLSVISLLVWLVGWIRRA